MSDASISVPGSVPIFTSSNTSSISVPEVKPPPPQWSVVEPVTAVASASPLDPITHPLTLLKTAEEPQEHLNDLFYHRLTHYEPEVQSNTSLKPLAPVTPPAPKAEVIIKTEKATSFFGLLMILASLLSFAEVIKSLGMAFRLLAVEFSVVEEVVGAGQLTEELFIRFSAKVGFIVLALIFSCYAVVVPWISAHPRQRRHLWVQIGLILLVLLLLGVSTGLRYVPLSTEITETVL